MIQESSLFREAEIEISIVLPCYNESSYLPSSLETLSFFLSSLNRSYEIVVSDDGSTDATYALDWPRYKKQFKAVYLNNKTRTGKGGALKQGFLACRGNFIFFTDADLPIELEALTKSLHILENGHCEIVIGDRRLPGSKTIGSCAMQRHLSSKLFNILVQLLVLPGYIDTQCCMKGFTRLALQKLLPITFLSSYTFDVELLYLAKLGGLHIIRIPVYWKDVRAHLRLRRLIYMTFSCLKDIICIRLRHRQSIY